MMCCHICIDQALSIWGVWHGRVLRHVSRQSQLHWDQCFSEVITTPAVSRASHGSVARRCRVAPPARNEVSRRHYPDGKAGSGHEDRDASAMAVEARAALPPGCRPYVGRVSRGVWLILNLRRRLPLRSPAMERSCTKHILPGLVSSPRGESVEWQPTHHDDRQHGQDGVSTTGGIQGQDRQLYAGCTRGPSMGRHAIGAQAASLTLLRMTGQGLCLAERIVTMPNGPRDGRSWFT